MNQEYQKKDDEPYRTKAPCPNCVDVSTHVPIYNIHTYIYESRIN